MVGLSALEHNLLRFTIYFYVYIVYRTTKKTLKNVWFEDLVFEKPFCYRVYTTWIPFNECPGLSNSINIETQN